MGNLDHPTPSLFSMKLLLLVSLLTSFVFSVGLIGVTTNGEAIHTVDLSSVPVQVGSTEVARIDNLDNSGDSWSAVAYDSANSRYLVAAKFGSSYKILSIGTGDVCSTRTTFLDSVTGPISQMVITNGRLYYGGSQGIFYSPLSSAAETATSVTTPVRDLSIDLTASPSPVYFAESDCIKSLSSTDTVSTVVCNSTIPSDNTYTFPIVPRSLAADGSRAVFFAIDAPNPRGTYQWLASDPTNCTFLAQQPMAEGSDGTPALGAAFVNGTHVIWGSSISLYDTDMTGVPSTSTFGFNGNGADQMSFFNAATPSTATPCCNPDGCDMNPGSALSFALVLVFISFILFS